MRQEGPRRLLSTIAPHPPGFHRNLSVGTCNLLAWLSDAGDFGILVLDLMVVG